MRPVFLHPPPDNNGNSLATLPWRQFSYVTRATRWSFVR